MYLGFSWSGSSACHHNKLELKMGKDRGVVSSYGVNRGDK